MATMIFSAIGTLIGGPLGGAIGAFVGEQVDNSLFGGSIQGPRLNDLTVTTSSYGSPVPQHFGRMRVAGSIIWATDLVEHGKSQGGKGSPSVTTYSYTSSFAVALSSRVLQGVGRIWADGTLLRGAAGDLKVGGTMRFYDGSHGQPQDSLIASDKGAALCPAFRGTAYVVFENLDLSNFGNRIPALTFEVFADNGPLTLQPLFDGLPRRVAAAVPLDGIAGYSSEGTYKATLGKFQAVFPMSCDADGTALTIAPDAGQVAPVMLAEPAVSETPGDVGGKSGLTRKRAPLPVDPPLILRYYDRDLDYQPGSQRAFGRATAGQPRTVQLPATLAAADAFALTSKAAQRAAWARETVQWRSATLDPAVVPGILVSVPGHAGTWRVTEWEWQAHGVQLTLERIAPASETTAIASDGGAARVAADLPVGATALVAFELPFQATGGSGVPQVFAAASSAGAGWAGAGLYLADGSGTLTPTGTTDRQRAIIGSATNALPPASPLVFDRSSHVTVQLIGSDMALTSASADQLIAGANRALLGRELIQFTDAVPGGAGVWTLSGLLRGRGATEGAIDGHVAGEPFVLIDSGATAVTLPAGIPGGISIAALGLSDAGPVTSAIVNAGLSLTPPAPVRLTAVAHADGSVTLNWTRRARGIWPWSDGVDVPLVEETESWRIGFGAVEQPLASWTSANTTLSIAAASVVTLRAAPAESRLWVRQTGTYALSSPTFIDLPAAA